jgi:hypothetical protein
MDIFVMRIAKQAFLLSCQVLVAQIVFLSRSFIILHGIHNQLKTNIAYKWEEWKIGWNGRKYSPNQYINVDVHSIE